MKIPNNEESVIESRTDLRSKETLEKRYNEKRTE